ncbi:MAG: isopentenyl phosphate kinase [Caldilineaceae bacterium]|nr:isopentenyl phosphate kinase [Caldilineaceae bacterium]
MPLIYLKLGGSLITQKDKPETARLDVLARLTGEIARAREALPGLQLVLGHGSGSFGHVSAQRHGTRDGVHSEAGWYGFACTADAAARLNRIVAAHLLQAELPAWTVQPSAALRCEDGKVVGGPAETVRLALARGLLPLIHGDVALDSVRGGTIASTEEIFEQMAAQLPPVRIVLAGEVDGVYSSDPRRDPTAVLLREITPLSFGTLQAKLGASHATDVTGGMAAKVEQSLRMVRALKGLEVIVCGGLTPDAVFHALTDLSDPPGTLIHAGTEQDPS